MFVRQDLYFSKISILPSCKENYLEICAVELEIKWPKLNIKFIQSAYSRFLSVYKECGRCFETSVQT